MHEIREPKLDQWYLREDTGEKFLVTDYDEASETVEIQTADGDLDEFDQEVWDALPLSFAAAPHDWTVPIDTLGLDDGEGVETEPDGSRARAKQEPWEDSSASEEEFDSFTERVNPSDLDS